MAADAAGQVEPRPEISVIAPMYQEEAVIAENIERLRKALEGLRPEGDWELVLVNDGSRDGTLEAARQVLTAIPQARLVTYDANRGRGFALRQGFAVARGRYLVTTESDLSWGADIVGKIYRTLQETGADVVLATPHGAGGRLENVPLHRRLLSKWGNVILTASLPGDLTMVTGMTRGYRREVVESLDLQSDRKEFHLEVVSKALALGYRITEVPAVLRWEPPEPGKQPKRKSKFPMFRFIGSHLAFSMFEKPILWFGLGGLLFLLGGLAFGVYVTVLRLQGALTPSRPLISLVVLLVLSGMLLFAFGFIAIQNAALKQQIYRLQGQLHQSLAGRLPEWVEEVDLHGGAEPAAPEQLEEEESGV